jgi:hypothetical protein
MAFFCSFVSSKAFSNATRRDSGATIDRMFAARFCASVTAGAENTAARASAETVTAPRIL